jgi:hypothetical protein
MRSRAFLEHKERGVMPIAKDNINEELLLTLGK